MSDPSTEVPVVLLAALVAVVVAGAIALVVVRSRHAERMRRIESIRNDLLGRLALAADYRDHRAQDRAARVARTAGLVARGLGLSAWSADEIEQAARFLDIGNLAIPDAVLDKGDDLTPDERHMMESHTLVGAELLAGEGAPLELAAKIALSHHERWDGRGYPHGLAGGEIPLAARIVSVADRFHALVDHTRPRSVETAVAEIEQSAGRAFDPAVVDAFSGLRHHSLTARRTEP